MFGGVIECGAVGWLNVIAVAGDAVCESLWKASFQLQHSLRLVLFLAHGRCEIGRALEECQVGDFGSQSLDHLDAARRVADYAYSLASAVQSGRPLGSTMGMLEAVDALELRVMFADYIAGTRKEKARIRIGAFL